MTFYTTLTLIQLLTRKLFYYLAIVRSLER